ncbi:cyclopropane-fatty-acyl-phospholipid synthase [Polynucleobacter sp. SHI8]|uniref:SAM-dependent methyltransferase n=1 Tax=unclassified Polynucleobacter TaxID=2640945 RepID=UPI00248F5E93|nr:MULTISPECIES: cyclopropane-fatty-acyl-phospholipid synthase family protein [unclassified Polynucleobacter]BDW12187.1 cyclopropane-fatty-acyl-phospholipid synthase [Polynucleobacter sp. SHI2]BDW14635.1 cyclopropane-fatty-acyl-phospholipid synthase [Polynucleobacter sp. SHI8]
MSTFAQKFIFQAFKNIKGGSVIMTLPDGSQHQFGQNNQQPPIHIQVNDIQAFKWVISRGDIGVAESYFKNLWHTDDLERFLHLAIQNRAALDALIYGSWWGSLFSKVKHFLNKNTKTGSKKNIQAHYDLGNNFYSLWLDPSMMYSSALFSEGNSKTLEQAQKDKCDRIIGMLNPQAGDHILEIGCGWGGFIKQANEQGLHVDAITISNEQYRYVQEQLAFQASPAAKSAVMLKDYRDCHQQYDGIVSIEMFEAVGEEYWQSYFKTIYRCLKPGKRAVIQSIVIDEALFPKYRTKTDFIQQYVFPGGMLPAVSVFEQHAHDVGLRVKDKLFFGDDYANTLRTWALSFNDKLKEVKALGFKDEFIRLWNFYLFYCAAGFAGKNLDVVQFTLEKPLYES